MITHMGPETHTGQQLQSTGYSALPSPRRQMWCACSHGSVDTQTHTTWHYDRWKQSNAIPSHSLKWSAQVQYNYNTTAIQEFFLVWQLATARRRAMDRSAWRLLVETATSTWHAPERDRWQLYCTCADPCNTPLQYKFSTTRRKLAGYLQQL